TCLIDRIETSRAERSGRLGLTLSGPPIGLSASHLIFHRGLQCGFACLGSCLALLFLLALVLAQKPLLLGGQDRLTFGLAVGLQLVETLLKILDLRVVLGLN